MAGPGTFFFTKTNNLSNPKKNPLLKTGDLLERLIKKICVILFNLIS